MKDKIQINAHVNPEEFESQKVFFSVFFSWFQLKILTWVLWCFSSDWMCCIPFTSEVRSRNWEWLELGMSELTALHLRSRENMDAHRTFTVVLSESRQNRVLLFSGFVCFWFCIVSVSGRVLCICTSCLFVCVLLSCRTSHTFDKSLTDFCKRSFLLQDQHVTFS